VHPANPDDRSAEPATDAPSRAYANYVLAVLFLVYVFNFVDRQILAILLQPIKEELGVSDTAMGFLTGFAFALFYTIAGIPIARLADGGSRRTVIAIGVAVWSAMTAISGLARSFAQLAAARVGVGVGEAAASPAANSLISDYFPTERRATALAIYNMGANVGIMFGFWAGAWIGENLGWRAAFMVVGLPGLAVAVLVRLTVREPPRRGESAAAGDPLPPFRVVLAHMWARRSFRHLSLAAALFAFASYGFTTWGATFLIRVHGLTVGESGLWMGLILGVGGAIGTFTGGRLCDVLGARDARWMVWIPAIGALGALPLLALFLLLPDRAGALLCYAPAVAFSLFFVGPSYAVTQGLAPPRMRAQATALLLFVINLIGLGAGPLAVGALNDALDPRFGVFAIRYSLLAVAFTNLWAVAHSLLAARTVRDDLERAL
jgi:predicted MFS family arabinose efflux permease